MTVVPESIAWYERNAKEPPPPSPRLRPAPGQRRLPTPVALYEGCLSGQN